MYLWWGYSYSLHRTLSGKVTSPVLVFCESLVASAVNVTNTFFSGHRLTFPSVCRKMERCDNTQQGEGKDSQLASQVATGRGAFTGTTARGTTRGSTTGPSPHVDAAGEARMGLSPHSAAAVDSRHSHAANQAGDPGTDGSETQTHTGTTLLSVDLDQYR